MCASFLVWAGTDMSSRICRIWPIYLQPLSVLPSAFAMTKFVKFRGSSFAHLSAETFLAVFTKGTPLVSPSRSLSLFIKWFSDLFTSPVINCWGSHCHAERGWLVCTWL